MGHSKRMVDQGISSEEDSEPESEMELEEEGEENGDYAETEEEEGKEGEDNDDDYDDGNDNEHENEDEEEEANVMDNDAQKDAEMEELEKEYMNLRHEEQDILKNLKRNKDEDVLKGQSVKNQKALWDKSLEVRILLQKVFSSSNKLPQEPLRSSFCDSDETVQKAYSDLITSSQQTLESLVELQEALLEKNPSILQVANGIKKRSRESEELDSIDCKDNEEWLQIQQLHSRIAPFRDNSIDKWQRKTQVTTGATGFKGKFQALNQNISQQVSAYMRDPSRMINRMQLRRSTVGVLGDAPDMSGCTKEEGAIDDGDPELLDDSEFYQQFLKEFLESFDPTSSETAFYALKRLQTKKRKIVDRRASKSRKIRYNVHEKIVNFMAPESMSLPPEAPVLFDNLFGLKYHKGADAVHKFRSPKNL
ncbi:hypothetical protein Sjap_002233 [Stephania japonica]|uniref:Protein AATF n=1 Tax=Stephania japonica TaxID=461633 RepID=A0AAP0KLJ4_9MAGN